MARAHTLDGAVERASQEGEGRYRLTLLHKSGENVYAFLSNGLQEMGSEQPLESGITLSASRQLGADMHADVKFLQRGLAHAPESSYYVLTEQTLFGEKSRVIPFAFGEAPPSVIVDGGLESQLQELFRLRHDRQLGFFEDVGANGLLRAFWHSRSPSAKKRRQEVRALNGSIEGKLKSLFREEPSPSRALLPVEYAREDRDKSSIFVDRFPYGKLIKAGLSLPYFAYTPRGFFDLGFPNLAQKYQQRFGQGKGTEARAAFGELLYAHPKAEEGFRRMYDALKHVGNMSLYAVQLAATWAANSYAPEWVGKPLTFLAVLSGSMMAVNLVASKGRDSSGLISTVLNRGYERQKLV